MDTITWLTALDYALTGYLVHAPIIMAIILAALAILLPVLGLQRAGRAVAKRFGRQGGGEKASVGE